MPEKIGAGMHPLGAGAQGGASRARIGVLRYVLGLAGSTSSSWRVLDLEEWV